MKQQIQDVFISVRWWAVVSVVWNIVKWWPGLMISSKIKKLFVSPSSLLSSSLVCRGWTLRSWVSPVSLPCQSSEDHKIGSRSRSGWSSLKTKVCPPVTSGLMNTIKRIKTGQTLRQNIWTFVSARRGWTIIKEINLTCLVCCLAAGYLLIFSIPSQWFMSLWV